MLIKHQNFIFNILSFTDGELIKLFVMNYIEEMKKLKLYLSLILTIPSCSKNDRISSFFF
ncbi:hypothetical protein CXF67_15970 [Psychroflexus sp. MES1-P1E]|nr:hypothetical protein CXF67_15970 [Psychroflexus sp. MES1-P1E]